MDDYFEAVRAQLSARCAEQAHRRRRFAGLGNVLVRPRLSTLAAATAALVTVAVFAFALGSLRGHDAGSVKGHSARGAGPPAVHPAALASLSGITQSGVTLGAARAPVRATLWGDLECPICREFVLGRSFGTLLRRDVARGVVKLRFRSLCTTTCSIRSTAIFQSQQAAAYAAGRQNRFWDYAFMFLSEQGAEGTPYVDSAFPRRIAREVPGLDLARWQRDRFRHALGAQVRADEHLAAMDRVDATPTLVIGGPGGTVTLTGAVTSAAVQRAVARVRRAPTHPSRSVNLVIRDCLANGRLTHRYTRRQLERALAVMPVAVRQYTNCHSVLSRALRHAR